MSVAELLLPFDLSPLLLGLLPFFLLERSSPIPLSRSEEFLINIDPERHTQFFCFASYHHAQPINITPVLLFAPIQTQRTITAILLKKTHTLFWKFRPSTFYRHEKILLQDFLLWSNVYRDALSK
jgi:hypothetical protein